MRLMVSGVAATRVSPGATSLGTNTFNMVAALLPRTRRPFHAALHGRSARAPVGYAGPMLLGAHESVAGGLPTAVARGRQDGCEAIQIFARPSAQWRARPLDREEISAFRSEHAVVGWPLLSHTSYLINVGATDPVILGKSCAALEEELVRAEELGLDYVVLHPGAHLGLGEEQGIARVCATLGQVLGRTRGFRTRLLLELTPGQGSRLGCSFAQLGRMLEGTRGGEALGLCFDTCHAYAAGYDLTTDEGFERAFAELDREVGLPALR